MFKLQRDLLFWVFYLFSSSVFILIFGLAEKVNNDYIRGIYTFFTVWLGFIFILLFTLFGYDIIRQIIDLDPFSVGPIIIGIVFIATIIGLVNANFIRISEIVIPREIGVASASEKKNTKLVQLSDLHLGPVHGKEYLEKIVAKINPLDPDLVVITGDLADGPAEYPPDYFSPLDNIKAPVYFTTGNHENYAGVERIIGLLGNTKVRVLNNQKVDLGKLELIGINNTWNKKDVHEIVKGLSPSQEKFTILMNHQPVGFKEVSDIGVNLMLSGHTHGGQFFPFTFLARIAWRGRKGLKKFKNAYMYVTNGTGTWGPPIRLGTSSEIALIRIVDS